MSQLHINKPNAPFIFIPENQEDLCVEWVLMNRKPMHTLAEAHNVVLDTLRKPLESFPTLEVFFRQTVKGNLMCELSMGINNAVSFITPKADELYAYVKGFAYAIDHEERTFRDIGEYCLSEVGMGFNVSNTYSTMTSSIPNLYGVGSILKSLELMKSLDYLGYVDYIEEQAHQSGRFTMIMLDNGLVGVSDYSEDCHIVWEDNYLTYYYLLGMVDTFKLVYGKYKRDDSENLGG